MLAPGRGANAAMPSGSNVPPLHHAVRAVNPAVTQVLLAAGAQADAVDGRGRTVIHLLVKGCIKRQADLRAAGGLADPSQRV